MARLFPILFLALVCGVSRASVPLSGSVTMPDFPLPEFVVDAYGQPEQIGMIRLVRYLFRGGVGASGDFSMSDSAYALVSSESIGLLSAWIEVACKAAGIHLAQARSQHYDGSVYAVLLETATNIAAARDTPGDLAIPLGVMICNRREPWGVLPGDNQRDAYVILATERGLIVFDPPTRQMAPLADYPNNTEVVKIRF